MTYLKNLRSLLKNNAHILSVFITEESLHLQDTGTILFHGLMKKGCICTVLFIIKCYFQSHTVTMKWLH